MKYRDLLLIILFFCLVCITTSQADSFGINIYGLSYHTGIKNYNYDRLNETNKGFGVRADFGEINGNSILIEGGRYNDTFDNDAKYISLGYQYRIWQQLRFGLNFTFYNSKSLNWGKTIFAPIPILSYRFWRITLNTVYLPKHDKLNPFHVFGAYLTFNVVQGK